jgi:excisionase family DNA binding protein
MHRISKDHEFDALSLDGPDGESLRLLRQIPAIRDGLDELRSLLSGRRKSLLTVEEFAREVGRSAYTVREWHRAGKISAIRVSGTGPKGRLLIAREELDRVVGAGLADKVADIAVG